MKDGEAEASISVVNVGLGFVRPEVHMKTPMGRPVLALLRGFPLDMSLSLMSFRFGSFLNHPKTIPMVYGSPTLLPMLWSRELLRFWKSPQPT